MLSCKEVAELSSDYLEKDLSLWKKINFYFHLVLCGRCRDFIRHLKISIAMFNAMPDKTLSDDDAQRITNRAIESKK